jgi:hypothetical protein
MAYLVQGGAPPDASVTTAKIAANAVDETKLKDALVADFTEVTVAAGDSILLGDVGDSGNTKRDTVQGILDLAGGGFTEITPVATTSGTSAINFTIPSGAQEVVVNAVGVSFAGAEQGYARIGDSGGIETSSYTGLVWGHKDETLERTDRITDHIALSQGARWESAEDYNFELVLRLIDASAFLWTARAAVHSNDTDQVFESYTSKALSAEMTQLEFGSLTGFTFDEGTLYCMTR